MILSYQGVLFLLSFFLSGCGASLQVGNPSFLQGPLTHSLLRAPQMDLDSTAPPVFHPLFTQENYEVVLQVNDLSYAIANQYGYVLRQTPSIEYPIDRIRARIQGISDGLEERGWSHYQEIPGRT